MLLIMFNYCSSPAKLTTATPRNIVNTNKVKTLIVDVSKQPNNQLQFNVSKTIIKEGYIKYPAVNINVTSEDVFICELMNDKSQVLQVIYIENPLVKHLEYSQEDGSMKKTTIRKNTGTFSIRINDSPNISNINIKIASKPNTILKTITL